jgi:acyl-CoA thioesterase
MSESKKFGLENYQHRDHFGEWLGYTVVHADTVKNETVTRLKLRSDHLSPAGRVHGGVISAFFDFSLGATVFTTLKPKDFCSTVEIKVNYFRPFLVDDLLEVKSQLMFRGNRLCVVQGVCTVVGDEKYAALAVGTFNIVSKSPS